MSPVSAAWSCPNTSMYTLVIFTLMLGDITNGDYGI